MIDFDAIDTWGPSLDLALQPCVPHAVRQAVRQSQPRFVEDASEALLAMAPRDKVVEATLAWLRQGSLAAFHGTRLTVEEADAVRRQGLLPFASLTRRARLQGALSRHPGWHAVESRLDAALQRFGPGGAASRRERQVHLTLSRAALLHGFNHYLTFGAEFDQHVAHHLLGEEGQGLLTQDGLPMIVQAELPGGMALEAAHPHFSVDDLVQCGELPSLVRDFLQAWAYRLVDPVFQTSGLRTDCGISFRHALAPQYIHSVQQLDLRGPTEHEPA
jgi:hypothetical protein